MSLRVQSLSKRFGKKLALNGIDFVAESGSLTALLGAAGAGKTTTLRMISGLDVPDAGRVELDGRDITGAEPNKRDLAMIFDNLALYPTKTGFDNIASPLRIAKLDEPEVERKVRQVAKTLAIGHVLERLPKTMSGGERQRIALGRALVRSPAFFLLDEPLSSLDAMLRLELRAELRRLQEERGYSFLMATPDYAEALAIADRVAVLREGKVVQIAPPQTIYDHPINRETARLVGAPEINLFLAAAGDRFATGNRTSGQIFAPSAFFEKIKLPVVELGVRPEDVLLGESDGASLTAHVIDIEPLGLRSTVTVETRGVRLLASISTTDHPFGIGDRVGVCFRPGKFLAFDPVSGRRL